MTVIVWDGTTLAVDRAGSDSYTKWEQEKSWIVGESVIAGTGRLDTVLRMRRWFTEGGRDGEYPELQKDADTWGDFIIVDINGLRRYERTCTPIEHGFNKCAFGSGKEFAYGVLAMGGTAHQAVQVANKYSQSCGIGIDLYTFKEGKLHHERHSEF